MQCLISAFFLTFLCICFYYKLEAQHFEKLQTEISRSRLAGDI